MTNPIRKVFRRLFDATFGREIDRRIEAIFDREIDRRVDYRRLHGALVFGEYSRLSLAPSAIVNNALFNTVSGRIVVHEHAFFGHNVCVLTGTHDVASFGERRQKAIPPEGRDVVIKTGAWIASNAIVLGPCTIGEDAVVAAGAVVIEDVPAYTIVGGIPARVIGQVSRSMEAATNEMTHITHVDEGSDP